jgi:hypothetical protein
MAGSSLYTAILDANVLYPFSVRDLLLSLAHEGLFHARWTARIQDEWVRNLIANQPGKPADKIRAIANQMDRSIPDCLITGYEPLIDGLRLPDDDDRHVLAAAIVGHADTIATFNLKDFPAAMLDPFGIEAVHPDDFVLNQLDLRQLQGLEAIKKMRARLRKPPMTTAELIEMLEHSQLPLTAAKLREAEGLI